MTGDGGWGCEAGAGCAGFGFGGGWIAGGPPRVSWSGMPCLRALLLGGLLAGVLAPAVPARGADGGAAEGGSLQALVDDLARELERRAERERFVGAVRVEVEPARGIDAGRVERAFVPRLKRRLKEGGVLQVVADAQARCRVTLSEEGGLLWATSLCEGGTLVGPTAVAVSRPVDKELESALGATVTPPQTRFALDRLGVVAPGVLDVILLDTNGDGADELVVLGADALRAYAVGGARLERFAVNTLPADRRWPRIVTGWLARLEGERAWLVTSAGHSLLWDARLSRFDPGPGGLVPLRGALAPATSQSMATPGPLSARWRLGSPVAALPLVTLDDAQVKTGLPALVRDVATVPGRSDTWIAVDEQGQLLSQRGTASAVQLSTERVGDRVVLADLNGDGEPELVTTAASAPGEADHLVLRRLHKDLSSSSVVFRSQLSGGSIVAAASGRLEPGGRVEVVLIEEVGTEAVAWRLRYSP